MFHKKVINQLLVFASKIEIPTFFKNASTFEVKFI